MKVYYGRKSRKSGRVLQAALVGIPGPSINFGYCRGGEINPPAAVALAANKRLALKAMAGAGVPTPKLWIYPEVPELPCVARPDKHRGGSHFWLCHDPDDVYGAVLGGATHFTEFIEGGREFRVHIVGGKSIKLAEKLGGDSVIKNFKKGSIFMYPQDFNHKKTLRSVARQAVMSLGLDFGAVDVIYKDDKWYVLEVNTAPSLTSNSDILERYVRAFKEL